MKDREINETTDTGDAVLRLPTIAMRGLVAFPKMVMHFDVARDISVKAVQAALKGDRKVFLVAQKDLFVEAPKEKDLYRYGVVAEVRQTLRTQDNILRVLIEGVYKAKLIELSTEDDYLVSEVKRVPNYTKAKVQDSELTAMMRSLKNAFEKYAALIPQMPKELIISVLCQDNPQQLFENITYNIALDYTDRQSMLDESNIFIKLSLLYGYMVREIEVLGLEKQIHDQVRENIDKGQREYYLREQMKVISSQLGEDDENGGFGGSDDAYSYLSTIYDLKAPDEVKEKLTKEAERLIKMPSASQEALVIRNYLDTVLDLPWGKATKSKVNIEKAQAVLDKDHYGLEKVKDRILETIAVHALMPEVTGQIICLVGPPGIGKTSIGQSIAKALGRKYARVSLGGVKDESDIRGHRKTYVGAMPGRIITAMKQAGSSNPVIMLDEIDKMSNDFKGDPSAAMLEVLDPEQNKAFRDHYIEVPFDLSRVLFITTANTTQTIPAPLLDRMEVIELTSYTREEKFHIAREHLVSKQIKKNGLRATQMKVDDSAIYSLIDFYTKEAGVRNLERSIASLCRKTAKAIVEEKAKRICFTESNLEDYLGVKKFLPDEMSETNQVGVVNGLAYTSVGGVIMPLEVLILNGKGTVELTGSLGEVMKESAKIAVSYSRSVAAQYSIDENFYKEKDIHIHAPEGAVPKDGPSAGVTMVTSMISALSGIPARGDVAMTGEITLHGKVLPIGGLREKTMAAYKAGIRTVVIPKLNKPDLSEIDDKVKSGLNFVFAETLDDVLATALLKENKEKADDNIMFAKENESGAAAIHS